MLIQGAFRASHFVQLVIAHEYACFLNWDKKMVAISFNKGTWEFFKKNSDKSEGELFSFSDDGSFNTNDSLLKGLIEAKRKLVHWDDGTRIGVAKLITSIIEIWAGDLDKIEEIAVLQPGRNSTIESPYEDLMKIQLHPEEMQWKT